GRPDLDLALDDLARLQPPPLVVRMVRAVRQRLLRIELAVRRAQPALGHALQRLALLTDLEHVFSAGGDVADRGEDIHVLPRARHPEVEHDGPGDLGVLGHRRRLERDTTRYLPGAARRGPRIAHLRGLLRRGPRELPLDRPGILRAGTVDSQEEFRPLRALERPLVLEAEFVRPGAAAGADFELHRRLGHGAGCGALQPVVEPAQLIDARLERVERVEVGAGVYAQLLVPRRSAHVALSVPAQVQRGAAPVADGVEGDLDPVPARTVQPPVLRVEVLAHEVPEQIVVEGVRIVGTGLAQQVERGVGVRPACDEPHREDAAVIRLVAVLVRASFPRHDRLERWRLQPGDAPLEGRAVGDAAGADVPVAPAPLGYPLDSVVRIHRLAI